MSKLRISFLELVRTLGNHSGCHQLPERSFFYKGKQFPVCARCTGVTIGEAGAVIAALCGLRLPLSASAGLMAVMGAVWLVQESGIKVSTNRRRFVTGICGGFGLFSIYCRTLLFLLRQLKLFIKPHRIQ